MSQVRVRFAPSPTGHLHIGGARTALFCYLFSQNKKGSFLLRIEDTDEERSTTENMISQMKDLKWLGIDWDEGYDLTTDTEKGDYGPYRQSQRKDLYMDHAQKLIEQGKAFYCFLTDKEIDVLKEKAKQDGGSQHIESPYKKLPLVEAKEKIANGEKAAIRFIVPEEAKDYEFKDIVRGDIKLSTSIVGDFVIVRSSGMPVYNFCCTIDDALMKITHVFRGEDHLNNTLRQLLIYEAFGYDVPEFGHLSLILGKDRQKMSKRDGSTSVCDFKDKGFMPEAIVNYIALLGWSPKNNKEIMTKAEMVKEFKEESLIPSSASFDLQKLRWMNSKYLRALSLEELWSRIQPFISGTDIKIKDDVQWRNSALLLFKIKMETLRDSAFLFKSLTSDGGELTVEGREVMGWENSKKIVSMWKEFIATRNSITSSEFEEIQSKIKKDCEVKGAFLFKPLRVAITGHPEGLDIKSLVPLMDMEVLIVRADRLLV